VTPTQGPRPGQGTRSGKNSYTEGTPGLERRDQVLTLMRENGIEPYSNSTNGYYWFADCPTHTGSVVRISTGTSCDFACLVLGQEKCAPDDLIRAYGLDTLLPTELSVLDKLRAALIDSAGLEGIEPPRPLIAGLLQLDSIAWLQGKPGCGKSFIALDIGGCVGTGNVWQGFRVTQGEVLYVAAEGVSGVLQRVRAWESSMGEEMKGVKFLPMAVQSTNGAEWSAFVALAEEMKPALVVLDTQARITVGQEENSARDMGVFVDHVEQVRKATGACVLVVHHEGRAGEHMRGSTAIEGAATSIIRAAKEDDLITMSCVKQKDAADFEDFDLRLIPTDSSAILALTGPSTSDSLGKILGERWLSLWWQSFESEPVAVSTLIRTVNVTEPTFHRRKFSLIKAGMVVREGTGNQTKYRLSRDPTP